ncbi:fibrinogen-like protein 1 [Elysia marginata]|uniref:Fibrinogen-like protein 1 n=1 Tax=Elysia marginata TaxID=1093978 RepID=A0AAV4EB67_9GAST|nr:fibrinogen-like protein 1 [Elysia marginata]
MGRRLCLALMLRLVLCSCSQGLELTVNRDMAVGVGTRSPSCVFTCTENTDELENARDQPDSTIAFNNISSLSVFKRVNKYTGFREDARTKREVCVATVSKREPILTRVADGMKLTGSLEGGRAMVRVELFKPDDCQAVFVCQVQGVDAQGREAVSTATVSQEPGERGSKMGDGSLTPAVALQLLTSMQQVVTQSMANLENKIHEKLVELQIDFERRVGDRLDSFENRLEDKIDNNNNVNKLIELDVKLSSSVDKFRSEATEEIANSLGNLRREVQQDQREALNTGYASVEKTLNKTSQLLVSMGNDVDQIKSFGQLTFKTLQNESESLHDMLASGETVSHQLHDESINLSKDVLKAVKELESNTQNCSAVTQSELRNLLSELNTQISTDLQTFKRAMLPETCEKGMRPSLTKTRVYLMSDTKEGRNFPILCDTITDQGGWIIFQRRATGNTDFDRNWADYKHGFGPLDGDFWLGNDKLHALTRDGAWELRVDLQYKNRRAFAHYASFSIGSESEKYELNIGAYDGTAGDSLRYHNGSQFTTKDQDNDKWAPGNCVGNHKGGWWFASCDESNLNGHWGVKKDKGVEWDKFTRAHFATFTEMKIRRI